MGEKLTDIFMQLFCEKNSDGTKNLRLKGKELWQRIGARIGDVDMMKIADFLLKHPEIVNVDLCYNNIGDQGMGVFIRSCLVNQKSLQELNLAGCNLGPRTMKCLLIRASDMRLTTLKLNGNKIGHEGGQYLGNLLEVNDTIKHLYIGDTHQTLSSIPYLMSVIRHDIGKNKTLEVLDISRVQPSSLYYQYDPGHLAEQIGDMLKANPVLTELHAQKCEFDGHDIERLLYGMSFNKTLLMLDLGYNRIGDHGIELLANWLHTRPNLLGLNVAGNAIGSTGARALSFHMPFSKLRLLDLSKNRISDDGIVDILHTIKKPYMLRIIYIWGNNLSQKTYTIMERMFLSKVLDPENIDVSLYKVDGVTHHSYNPVDRYKHKYFSETAYPTELKIKRNRIEPQYAQPRALVQLQYYPRIPGVDDSMSPRPKPC